jgi:hypothetical protein
LGENARARFLEAHSMKTGVASLTEIYARARQNLAGA